MKKFKKLINGHPLYLMLTVFSLFCSGILIAEPSARVFDFFGGAFFGIACLFLIRYFMTREVYWEEIK